MHHGEQHTATEHGEALIVSKRKEEQEAAKKRHGNETPVRTEHIVRLGNRIVEVHRLFAVLFPAIVATARVSAI
jgi:hypothetical protein